MKIAHAMMVVQVMKIVHVMIVVQVMKIVYTMIVMQVMKTAHAMKAVMQVMKGEKVMRPGPELEDSFRDENSQIFVRLQSSLMNTSPAGLSISSLANGPLSAPPSPHLRDSHPPSIMSVLDPAPKRASPQRTLSTGRRSGRESGRGREVNKAWKTAGKKTLMECSSREGLPYVSKVIRTKQISWSL